MATVTRSPWNWGGRYGDGIDGYQLQPFRIRTRNEFESRGLKFTEPFNFKVQYGQLHGVSLPMEGHNEESERLGILYGYCQPYNRNLCKFVMSRAARKRGWKTDDWRYLNRQARLIVS